MTGSSDVGIAPVSGQVPPLDQLHGAGQIAPPYAPVERHRFGIDPPLLPGFVGHAVERGPQIAAVQIERDGQAEIIGRPLHDRRAVPAGAVSDDVERDRSGRPEIGP
jgi:hypothetical protein